jgi:hypothetical protein
MNVTDYLKSLSVELGALENRVRNFIEGDNWLTDGEWKESVLRTVLKRHLPASVEVARGFVIGVGGHSRQLDILLHDTSKPVLHRDGDLVFVTADAVKGIIDVKSKIHSTNLVGAINNLADNAAFTRSNSNFSEQPDELFVGLFAYGTTLHGGNLCQRVLDVLKTSADEDSRRVINHLCLGNSLFVRYWPYRPGDRARHFGYDMWHGYALADLSPGYFIHNAVDSVSGSSVVLNNDVWFPAEGKERVMSCDAGLYP